MLIPIGSKVVVKFTGESGRVVKDIDGEMFLVEIDGVSDHVPVHAIDLRIVEASEPMENNGSHEVVNDDLNISFAQGIHLVFKSADHHIINKRYTIYLANITNQDLVYEYQFRLGNENIHTESQRLTAGQSVKVGTMMYEDLNEKVLIQLQKAELKTTGLGEWRSRNVYIKIKQFFNKQQISVADGCIYHQYLLHGWTPDPSTSNKSKLIVQPKKFKKAPLPSNHHISTAGNFDIEIDLHIHNLTAHHEDLDKFQKLTIQLEAMKRYIDTAKKLRIDHVFLIHGIGKGRLRDEIAKYLKTDEDIVLFRNEHHPKYGFGATEVVFR